MGRGVNLLLVGKVIISTKPHEKKKSGQKGVAHSLWASKFTDALCFTHKPIFHIISCFIKPIADVIRHIVEEVAYVFSRVLYVFPSILYLVWMTIKHLILRTRERRTQPDIHPEVVFTHNVLNEFKISNTLKTTHRPCTLSYNSV